MNLEVHYRVQENLSLVPILSKTNPVHTFPPTVSQIHSDIFPSMSRSTKWSICFMFPDPAPRNCDFIFVLPSDGPYMCVMSSNVTQLN